MAKELVRSQFFFSEVMCVNNQEKQINYGEFIGGIEVKEIVLLKLDVERRIEFAAAGKLDVALSTDFHLIDQDGHTFRARADFDLFVTDSADEVVLTIKASFMIIYESSNEYTLSGEEEKFFVTRNVPLNVWPFARELISSMTTRLGYPALLISPYVLTR